MKLFRCTAILSAALLSVSCQSASPEEPAFPLEQKGMAAAEAASLGTVRVDASALNIRSEPSMSGEVLAQVKRGERLPLLETGESWMMVRLPDGRTGWAASRFLLQGNQKPRSRTSRRGSCPPDSDFAFVTAPTPTFSDSDQSGEVVVEAHVGVDGNVRSTTVIRNTTGDDSLAFLTEREIASATFIAPVQNCVAREFIYTYRRSF